MQHDDASTEHGCSLPKVIARKLWRHVLGPFSRVPLKRADNILILRQHIVCSGAQVVVTRPEAVSRLEGRGDQPLEAETVVCSFNLYGWEGAGRA